MAIILFFLVLFVLVLVHEWGHFIVAKKTGMRVDEFGIGFPPKAASFKRGETEYTLNWLPIGGFVRIWGENMEENAIDEAGNPIDTSRAFSNRPKWAQALVLIAGIAMNIIFAWFLFVVTLMIGVPTQVDETAASSDAQMIVASTMTDSPAAVIPDGAEIVTVSSGETILEAVQPQAFADFVTTVAPSPIELTYTLGDSTESVTITPTQGLDESDRERYIVGISLALIETQRSSVGAAFIEGSKMTVDVFVNIVVGVFTLIGQSFAGTADYSQVAGPIGIVNLVGDAASFGVTSLLIFTAIISLNLAVINLLPVPALDGGRLVFVAIEAVTGKHIPPVWAGRVNFIGFVLLMILMIAVTYNDILRLL